MAKTTEIKKRIETVESIGSITNAMYLVSMAKLQKNQKRIETLKKYDEIVQDHVQEIISAMEYIDAASDTPLLRVAKKDEKPRKVAYIVFTSNLGLCGGYNTNIIKYLEEELAHEKLEKSYVYMVGKMGATRAKGSGIKLFKTLESESDVLRYSELRDGVVNDVIRRYNNYEFDAVRVVYTKYINPLVQTITTDQILPLVPMDYSEEDGYPPYVIFEPSRSEVLDYLITKNVKTSVYIKYLESQTSEEAIRRTSMDNANKNGQELVEKLQLVYNRERQAAITQEMAEIIGGSEIL